MMPFFHEITKDAFAWHDHGDAAVGDLNVVYGKFSTGLQAWRLPQRWVLSQDSAGHSQFLTKFAPRKKFVRENSRGS